MGVASFWLLGWAISDLCIELSETKDSRNLRVRERTMHAHGGREVSGRLACRGGVWHSGDRWSLGYVRVPVQHIS